MSENSVSILFVGDGPPVLCIAAYLPLRPTLLGDFPACCGRRNASPTPLRIGIYRIPSHCEPVRFPGVAIPRLEAPLFVNKLWKWCKRAVCMTIGCPEFDGDSQVSSAHWFLNDNVVRCPVFPLQIPISRCNIPFFIIIPRRQSSA